MSKPKRQLSIAGTEGKRIQELDDASEAYLKARNDRMKRTETESAAKEALVSVMKKHDLTVYRDATADPPLIVTLVPGKDGIKVTEARDDEDGEGDAGEEA